MPVDYKNSYPPNWFTEIRPSILERAGHKCEQCGVPNYKVIIRGVYDGQPVYQDDVFTIYDAETSEVITTDYANWIDGKKFIKVILTIAHICHDSMCTNPLHLLALCQRCHLRLDMGHHVKNRKANKLKKAGQLDLFNQVNEAIMKFQVAPGTMYYETEGDYQNQLPDAKPSKIKIAESIDVKILRIMEENVDRGCVTGKGEKS